MSFFEGKNFIEIGDNFRITFYAICIVIGIIIAYFYGVKTSKRIGVSEDNLFIGFIGGTICGVLGARIYYCLFNMDKMNGFLDYIAIWKGGLAIHGAIIGAGIFCVIFCKIRKLKVFDIAELVAPGFLIGQACGRWGNFFNQELYGAEVTREFLEDINLPKFIIDKMHINGTYYHPTFLYESWWNLAGLAAILIARNNNKKYWMGDGVLFYAIWYSIGRYFTEELRSQSGAEEVLMVRLFGQDIRQSQLISIVLIVVASIFFIVRRIFKIDPRSYIDVLESVKAQNKTLASESK